MPHLFMAGDFNLPDIEWASETLKSTRVYNTGVSYKMLGITRDNYISQVNFQLTRHRNILDLLFVTNPDLVKEIHTSPGMSDHDIVIADIDIKAKINRKTTRTVHLYGKANWTKIKNDLCSFQQ